MVDIMDDKTIIPANRVFQLESHNLNNEINKTIDQLVDNINIPIMSEEAKLAMKMYISANHLKKSTSLGMNIFNLNYYQLDDDSDDNSIRENLIKVNPKSYKLLLLTASNLILPYLMKRYNYIEDLINKSSLCKLRFSWITLDNLTNIAKCLNIINFLLFLFDSKQLLIQERLLGLMPGLLEKDYYLNMTTNKIQMEILNRDTIWRALAEFLSNAIPLINKDKLKNQLLKLTCLKSNHDDNIKLSDKISNRENIHKCAICEKQPFNPYVIGCGHVFCYYCLQSKYLLDTTEGYSCLLCKYATKNESQVMRFRAHNLDTV